MHASMHLKRMHTSLTHTPHKHTYRHSGTEGHALEAGPRLAMSTNLVQHSLLMSLHVPLRKDGQPTLTPCMLDVVLNKPSKNLTTSQRTANKPGRSQPFWIVASYKK